MSRWFIIVGIGLVVVGLILQYAPGLLNWFGKLPGDIKIESENSKVFFPLTSMIIISVILSVLLNFFKR